MNEMNDSLVTFETLGGSALKAQIELKAPPEKVYGAWTQPERLAKWFGPRSNGSLQVDAFDCRIGGKYDFTMVFADGDRVQIFGTYQEVDPPKKLVFTWQSTDGPAGSAETLVTVALAPSESGTHLTLTHERFMSAEARDRHQEGWGPLLVRLGSTVNPDSEAVSQAKGDFERFSARLLHVFSFVPDDKLAWSPSPTARSPLAIVAHCALINRFFASVIMGTMQTPMPTPEAFFKSVYEAEATITTRESALALLHETEAELGKAVNTATSENLGTERNSPFGPLPLRFWLAQAGEHLAGHARQIDYLQTIWGDLDNHLG